ncbi:MAG TPA: FecR domain-containing protein [Candidatus Limnocylindrales bacterium]|nr:FecR domain-containing protein [Candidatus Limnocylindrales bacterium]
MSDYLWDGSGSDAEVERLEKLLARFQGAAQPPAFPEMAEKRRGSRSVVLAWSLAAAASVLAVFALWYESSTTRRSEWTVADIVGSPQIDGVPLRASARWKPGAMLETDATSRAEMQLSGMGQIEVEPNSQVTLLKANADQQQFQLTRGEIRAAVIAPPYVFLVDTPSAYAMDMGCAYTLQVRDDGTSVLRVTVGWVDLQHGWLQSLVPEGAVAESRPGIGPGAPYYEDASEQFKQALEIVNFDLADEKARSAALTTVLAESRKRDALTLLNLFRRVDAEDRGRLYDRLSQMLPPIPGVTREDAMENYSNRLGPWWDALGLSHIKKGFKKPPVVRE